MEKILIIKSCEQCPEFDFNFSSCHVLEREVADQNKIDKYCPLKNNCDCTEFQSCNKCKQ